MNLNAQFKNWTLALILVPLLQWGSFSAIQTYEANKILMTSVSAGGELSLGITAQGRVYAWGLNGLGRLGDGTTTSRNTPTLINF
jgi:alpha-tubulin suppressor-like RCC1 family protein